MSLKRKKFRAEEHKAYEFGRSGLHSLAGHKLD